jgi:UDP-N-acetylmuramoylalanine--D-glutamate ligase
MGLTKKNIQAGVDAFKGMPERQEVIGVKRGITFIDDTTSTMPDATIAALRTISAPIVLIIGGTDKQLDFRELVLLIKKKVKTCVLLPGSATEKILKLFEQHKTIRYIGPVRSMQEAVDEAVGAADRGSKIVLSPGATSFGLFINEFDRGRAFQQAVKRSMKRA